MADWRGDIGAIASVLTILAAVWWFRKVIRLRFKKFLGGGTQGAVERVELRLKGVQMTVNGVAEVVGYVGSSQSQTSETDQQHRGPTFEGVPADLNESGQLPAAGIANQDDHELGSQKNHNVTRTKGSTQLQPRATTGGEPSQPYPATPTILNSLQRAECKLGELIDEQAGIKKAIGKPVPDSKATTTTTDLADEVRAVKKGICEVDDKLTKLDKKMGSISKPLHNSRYLILNQLRLSRRRRRRYRSGASERRRTGGSSPESPQEPKDGPLK
ncbi:hypothetical protein FQN54_000860 [Arachnomyces sp. PD_36]|nr:hypothetical protein FQN54_000860 [Arachnomyces sp. PD_36]